MARGSAIVVSTRSAARRLPEPPSLDSPRLRRPTSLVRPARALRQALNRDFSRTAAAVTQVLSRSGTLERLHRDATRRLAAEAKRAKGPVGRGGRPLGPERTRQLQGIFELDELRAVGSLMADDEDAFRLAITESLDDAYVDMFEAGGTAARRALGVRGAFRLESPAVAEALAQRANLLAGNVADDVFERLKTVLAEEFYFAGKGPFEVARTLRGEFDWLTKARSELLARTETGAIVSEASWITYSASGVPFKRWLATLDGKEREDHFDAHGQIRAIDEPYDVGGEQLMHPLDPAGSAAQVCNCGCDEVPVVTADQAFSDADVWDGTNNPDQFARERLADPDRPPRQTGPDPSATDDLDFAFPEDE